MYVVNILICTYSVVSSDFTGGEYPFTIQPAEQQTTISIPITDDITVDDITVEQLQEQFSVSLSVQPQPGVTLGNSEASVTIEDNDSESKSSLSQF